MVNDHNIRLGFLASHNGSTMQAIVDACISNLIKADPVVLISNNSSSGAMTRARQMNIPFHHLSSGTHPNFEDLDKAITYFERALKIRRSLNVKVGMCESLEDLAQTYYEKKEPHRALQYLQDSLHLHNELGNMDKVIHLKKQISNFKDLVKGDTE